MGRIMRRNNAALWQVLSPAGQLFVQILVASRMEITRGTATTIWGMISRSEDPEARGFLYATDRLYECLRLADDLQRGVAIMQYFSDWLTPDLLHGAVDELRDREELSPTACARTHGHIDEWSTPDGKWRWTVADTERNTP